MMPTEDLFGLTRESKINKSGIREIFTPHRPIQSADLFFGRQKEVQKIIEQINTPGQHSLLYGDRGVGKSSLANIATHLLISKLIEGKLYPKRCDSNDRFVSILEAPLKDFGFDISLQSTSTSHKQEGNAGIGIPLAKAGIRSGRSTTEAFAQSEITPSRAAAFLCDKHGLLYIDEADRLADRSDRVGLAEFIKLLSDCGSPFKVLIVGVAETAEELTGAHPSVQRCLKETKLGRMSDTELEQIVLRGASETKLSFDTSVVKTIVKLSSGYGTCQ